MPLCARACAYAAANRSTSSGSSRRDDRGVVEVESERRRAGPDLGLLAEQGQVGDPAAQQDRGGLAGSGRPRSRAARCACGRRGPAPSAGTRTSAAYVPRTPRRRSRPAARAWSTCSANSRRAVSILLRRVLGHRAPDPHQPLGRGEGAEVGERDRQVLLDAFGSAGGWCRGCW